MPAKTMPPDWEPPVDAWQSAFDEGLSEVVFAYFGCQFRDRALPEVFEQKLQTALKSGPAPSYVTRARHRDASGYENELFIAYWPSQTAFDDWWSEAGYGDWYDDDARLSEAFGLWREIYVVPVTRFETLHSSKDPTGVSKLAKPLGDPVQEHNYWGGMRDRIAESETDAFDPSNPDLHSTKTLRSSRGARMRVELADNICLIRSGQNWSQCAAEEIESYSDEVLPHLVAGMAFLRDNPAKTGCLSCRLMDEVALDGSHASQSFGLAAFTSMAHLEAWAKTHPTHLKIFNSFLAMVQKRETPPQLKLWHEVLVARGEDSLCDYVNCHPQTGFLAWCLGGVSRSIAGSISA